MMPVVSGVRRLISSSIVIAMRLRTEMSGCELYHVLQTQALFKKTLGVKFVALVRRGRLWVALLSNELWMTCRGRSCAGAIRNIAGVSVRTYSFVAAAEKLGAGRNGSGVYLLVSTRATAEALPLLLHNSQRVL